MTKHDTVERLAGGIAHDFDLLLTAIIGHAEMLSGDLSAGDPRAVQVTAIRRAAEQASNLTQQLLAFSRSQTLRPTVVDVDAAIERTRHGLQRVLGDRISLETRPGHRARRVRADAEQFDQILHNLAVSARGAMPDGGAVVVSTGNVRVRRGDARFGDVEPGEYVALSMTDTGAQIQSATQQHLFEPFFPAPEREPATGLGLAIVYGVVKQSGGHITVESPLGADGRGSRFTVYLPATCETSDAVSTDGETVLVVGDDRNVQTFIGDVLRRRGYRLLQASGAWDALHLSERHESQIDLLITTGTNGFVVANALHERRPTTRVLHVSASAEDAEDDAMEASRAPRAILAQPFTPSALARKVRAVMGQDGRDGQERRGA
jgi:two-component system, cell cycle sensor histidine kinase and response regulator CckA